MKKIVFLGSILSLSLLNAQNVYSYGFDSAFAADWTLTNQSSPATAVLWAKANYPANPTSPFVGTTTSPPQGHTGGSNSFAVVGITSVSAAGTISNWLITPTINVKDGDTVSFYTRKGTTLNADFPDRLEVRYSTAATTVNPSGGPSDVGSFTKLGTSVNPNLLGNFVYPQAWTKYSFTVTGVGTVATPVKIGFRYYVTDGGPGGNNGHLIGIDTFSVDRGTLAVHNVQADRKRIEVYPNPTNGFIHINSTSKVNAVEVLDASGRKFKANFDGEKVDVRDLQAGNYIVTIETKEGKTTEKFIKK